MWPNKQPEPHKYKTEYPLDKQKGVFFEINSEGNSFSFYTRQMSGEKPSQNANKPLPHSQITVIVIVLQLQISGIRPS